METKKRTPKKEENPVDTEKFIIGKPTGNISCLNIPTSKNNHNRRLTELKMLCNLSEELNAKANSSNLLAHVAKNAVRATQSFFSRIYTLEADGSFVCQARHDSNSVQEIIYEKSPAPIAAWLHFLKAINEKKPVVLSKNDPSLTPNEILSLELNKASLLWMLPLYAGAKKIGIFVLGFRENIETNLQSYNLLGKITNLADQATIGLQRIKINENLEKSFVDIILALAENIEADAPLRNWHEHQTAEIMVKIARYLKFSEKDVQNMRWAGLLHDIGKLEIPEELLQKPRPLTPSEWQIMEQHPTIGAELLKPVVLLKNTLPLIRHHHEKYDGTGYPDGLKGKEIPIGARMLTLADSYSVMVGGRIYRDAIPKKEAIYEIKRCSGTHFDPFVVNIFLELFNQGKIN